MIISTAKCPKKGTIDFVVEPSMMYAVKSNSFVHACERKTGTGLHEYVVLNTYNPTICS